MILYTKQNSLETSLTMHASLSSLPAGGQTFFLIVSATSTRIIIAHYISALSEVLSVPHCARYTSVSTFPAYEIARAISSDYILYIAGQGKFTVRTLLY